MKIEVTKIRDWFSPKMDLREAWQVVTREYCLPLSRVDACPGDCLLCRERLAAVFDLSQARKPAALLTYRARRERAIAVDEAGGHEAPDPHTNLSDDERCRGGEGGPFAVFLKTL